MRRRARGRTPYWEGDASYRGIQVGIPQEFRCFGVFPLAIKNQVRAYLILNSSALLNQIRQIWPVFYGRRAQTEKPRKYAKCAIISRRYIPGHQERAEQLVRPGWR